MLAGMVVAKRSAKRSALEALARTAPDDTNALALFALVQSEVNRPESAALAAEILRREAPLDPMRETRYVEERAIDALLGVAATLQARGDAGGALNQTRNAAHVAGAHGAGVTRSLCEALADAAERVEPGGVSAALASLAAHVHGKGP